MSGLTSDILPSTFDRADGLDGHPGIATPPGAIFINDNGTEFDLANRDYTIKLREAVTSPEIERAEQATITHTFLLDYQEACTRQSVLGRGTLLIDDSGSVSRILSTRVNRERGGWATLIVVAEGVSFDSPPDEFEVQPVELGIHIIKHPRYFSALNPSSTDASNYITIGSVEVSLADVKQSIIRAIQAYMDAPIYPSEYNINGYFQTNVLGQMASGRVDIPYRNPNYSPALKTDADQRWDGTYTGIIPNVLYPSDNSLHYILSVPAAVLNAQPGIQLAVAAAREIIEKIWRQEEQPYIVGYQISWHSYWFRPPLMSPGGYLDDPLSSSRDIIPDYFVCTDNVYDVGYDPSRLIFDLLPVVNPQCYSIDGTPPAERGFYGDTYNISWLRKADEIQYQRTWFRLTRTWIGAPIGMWDPDLYSGGSRPQYPEEYHTTFQSLTP